MDDLQTNPAEKSTRMQTAVCWQCGEELLCFEYVVCCTGTLFHICPQCEEKMQAENETEETAESAPQATAGQADDPQP